MKRFVTTIALTLVLSCSALAGDIPTDGSASPAPGGTVRTTTRTSTGDIPISDSAEQVSDVALSAFLTVLGFLAV
jgi:hypothetical protein